MRPDLTGRSSQGRFLTRVPLERHQISAFAALAADVAAMRAADICLLTPISPSSSSFYFFLPHMASCFLGPPSEEDVENEISDGDGGGSPGPRLHRRRSRHLSGRSEGARVTNSQSRRETTGLPVFAGRRSSATLASPHDVSPRRAESDFMTFFYSPGMEMIKGVNFIHFHAARTADT